MTAALRIQNLEKEYDNGVKALKGISLEVQTGDFFALLGKNGAGKSTAIGIISSLVNKTAGKVHIFDYDIDVDFPMARTQLGVVPQEINLSVFETPLQIVVNQAGFYGIDRNKATILAEKYLTQLGLWEKRHDVTRELSGGMKRRLMIARALMHQPKLLILDEPTAGVDIEIRRSMWEFISEINEQGTTIILTTHYLEEAENLCRNVAIIDQGRVVENTSTRELLAKSQREIYVLDLVESVKSLPAFERGKWKLVNPTCIEVDISKEQGINGIFRELNQNQIKVQSMRNKSNRLEQLFLDMTTEEEETSA
ncbi:MAG: ABC transporter ATP-binding protein [Acidiferrobacterales bacterium]|nr:ABC transporter ATP-binding protein [Acidiferrobacterales bacterium]